MKDIAYAAGNGTFLVRRSPVIVIASKNNFLDSGAYDRYAVFEESVEATLENMPSTRKVMTAREADLLKQLGTGCVLSGLYNTMEPARSEGGSDVEAIVRGSITEKDMLVPKGTEIPFEPIRTATQAESGRQHGNSINTIVWGDKRIVITARGQQSKEGGFFMLYAIFEQGVHMRISFIDPSKGLEYHGPRGRTGILSLLEVLSYWMQRHQERMSPQLHGEVSSTGNREVASWRTFSKLPPVLDPLKEKVPVISGETAARLGGLGSFSYEDNPQVVRGAWQPRRVLQARPFRAEAANTQDINWDVAVAQFAADVTNANGG